MKLGAALSVVLPLLAGSCAPAACNPTSLAPSPPATTPASTTLPVEPPLAPPVTTTPPAALPSGWTLCIDSDGGTVAERQPGNGLVTYSFPGTKMSQGDVDAAMVDVQARFAEWGVTVRGGSCEQDDRSFTIFLTPDKVAAQEALAAGWAGYAYIGGWGLLSPSGYNFGFVFTDYVSPDHLGVYVAHEAGHGAGLSHPWNPERNIMFDPDPALGWSMQQRSILTSKFSSGITVDGRPRPNPQSAPPGVG